MLGLSFAVDEVSLMMNGPANIGCACDVQEDMMVVVDVVEKILSDSLWIFLSCEGVQMR